MPRGRKPAKSDRERLAELPRRQDLTLIGGKQTLPIYLREHGATVQPQLILWMDPDRGSIYGFGLVTPGQTSDNGVSEALEILYLAITRPGASPGLSVASGVRSDLKAALPDTLVVNEAALADTARSVLEPLGVTVEHRASLPPFDAAVAGLAASLGVEPGAPPPEPFAWAIDPTLLLPLYKAAASLWRRAPWEYLPDHPPVVIGLGAHGPRDGVETLYASIMGMAEEVYGIAFYPTAAQLERIVADGEARAQRAGEQSATITDEQLNAGIALLRQAGVPVDQIPPPVLREMVRTTLAEEAMGERDLDEVHRLTADSLLVTFDSRDELDPTYREWIAAHHLPTASREAIPTFLANDAGGAHEPPNAREARALVLAIEALNQFFSRNRALLDGQVRHGQPVSDQLTVKDATGAPVTVSVSYTAPVPGSRGDLLEQLRGLITLSESTGTRQSPKKRATAAGKATLYRFQVKLDWDKSVWRRIELRGDQTLHDLHNAIQEAFDWDDDHLYAFFLSGKAWDEATEYESPLGDGRHANRYRLEHLPLKAGQRFRYIFDFGDQLEHTVKLEAVVQGGVQPGETYPRITERYGANVPQYPGLDEEDEGEDE